MSILDALKRGAQAAATRTSPRCLLAAGLLLATLAVGCGGDSFECGSQQQSGTPVEGCTDLLNCDYEVCNLSFGECDDGSPSLVCEGSTCTCFDGDEEIGSCDYSPDQCPRPLDMGSPGEQTPAMKLFESCCGVPVEMK